MKQGQQHHKMYSSYRSGSTFDHLTPQRGHKANGRAVSPTSALRQRTTCKQTYSEHQLETIASKLLHGKKLTDTERTTYNNSILADIGIIEQ
jgi:hypothetical protein